MKKIIKVLTESKKRRKKPYSSKTYTTGNPGEAMAAFNNRFKNDGTYLNGTIHTPEPEVSGGESSGGESAGGDAGGGE